jgi:hypothetical protein
MRREIKVDARAFLIPGTLVMIKFIESGWVTTVVSDSNEQLLSTNNIMNDKPVNLRGPGWFRGLKQNNIQICPN